MGFCTCIFGIRQCHMILPHIFAYTGLYSPISLVVGCIVCMIWGCRFKDSIDLQCTDVLVCYCKLSVHCSKWCFIKINVKFHFNFHFTVDQ